MATPVMDMGFLSSLKSISFPGAGFLTVEASLDSSAANHTFLNLLSWNSGNKAQAALAAALKIAGGPNLYILGGAFPNPVNPKLNINDGVNQAIIFTPDIHDQIAQVITPNIRQHQYAWATPSPQEVNDIFGAGTGFFNLSLLRQSGQTLSIVFGINLPTSPKPFFSVRATTWRSAPSVRLANGTFTPPTFTLHEGHLGTDGTPPRPLPNGSVSSAVFQGQYTSQVSCTVTVDPKLNPKIIFA